MWYAAQLALGGSGKTREKQGNLLKVKTTLIELFDMGSNNSTWRASLEKLDNDVQLAAVVMEC
jgi:hypothetical protein